MLRGLKRTVVLYGGTVSLTFVIEILLLEANIAFGPVHEVFTIILVSTAVFS